MKTYLEVDPSKLIEACAEELKKDERMTPPEWSNFVKTSAGKERLPLERDWWYIRAVSILRKVSILGPVGVNKLSVKYGTKKNRGVRPEKFYRGSRNIIRTLLKQLETMGFVKYVEKEAHKGRVITKEGIDFLNKVANKL